MEEHTEAAGALLYLQSGKTPSCTKTKL